MADGSRSTTHERERHEGRVNLDTVLGGGHSRPPASTPMGWAQVNYAILRVRNSWWRVRDSLYPLRPASEVR